MKERNPFLRSVCERLKPGRQPAKVSEVSDDNPQPHDISDDHPEWLDAFIRALDEQKARKG